MIDPTSKQEFDFKSPAAAGDSREHAAFGPAKGLQSVQRVGERYVVKVDGSETVFWAVDGAVAVEGEEWLAGKTVERNNLLGATPLGSAAIAIRGLAQWQEAMRAIMRRYRHFDMVSSTAVYTPARAKHRQEQRALVGRLFMAMTDVLRDAERQGDPLNQDVVDYHARHKTGTGHQVAVPADLVLDDDSASSSLPPLVINPPPPPPTPS